VDIFVTSYSVNRENGNELPYGGLVFARVILGMLFVD
jgi:hypothetical protein